MNQPLVSVIIPTYNRAHLIGETLDSVIAQTYTNWECIAVDDGSTDDTDKLLSEYCRKDNRFQYHHRPKSRPKGANACRNYGFELSKGEYVNWFDSDDLMHEDKLLIQINQLINSALNFSVCQNLVFENSIDNITSFNIKRIVSENTFEDYFYQKIALMTPSSIWKKSFLNSFNYLFDEELQAAQEWEFYCRVLFYCSDYGCVNQPLLYIRKHYESISYNSNVKLRGINYYKARVKVYLLIKDTQISNNLRSYFDDYFISYYKRFLKSRNIKKAANCLKNFIIPNPKIRLTYKIRMLFAFFIFGLFNRGEFIFRGNRFKNIVKHIK